MAKSPLHRLNERTQQKGSLAVQALGSNLAAMAAAAAANRGKLKAERPDLVGLDVMAAAKREQKMAMSSNADTAMTKGGSKEVVVGNQSPDKGRMVGRLDLGGLACMAAMVANKSITKIAVWGIWIMNEEG